jgi:hypothetical protein
MMVEIEAQADSDSSWLFFFLIFSWTRKNKQKTVDPQVLQVNN